jgi:hypothetical protein
MQASVVLTDGTVLGQIHQVIIVHVSLYLSTYARAPRDDVAIVDTETKTLVTDGSYALSLDRDMFYSHDPSLPFTVISSSITTFPLFEYQATEIKSEFG